MKDNDRDPTLNAVFANASQELAADDNFTVQVMSQTDKLKLRKIIAGIFVTVVLAYVSPPLQDLGLALAQAMVTSLVDLDNRLMAQLLAPINTVGGLLSFLLLGVRAYYKRLFT